MAKTALIGYTGFVGSNLLVQTDFTDLYNSQNIEQIKGREYDLLVCAGARAEKWKINQDPKTDLADIDRLIDSLKEARAKKCVLISTVDVYGKPTGVDEDTMPALATPYGRHRLYLEGFFNATFDTATLRLPGLFGQGLKKNVIFDFLHDNNLGQINSESSFQWYYLDRLWKDIQVALANGIALLNVATEPLTVAEIARKAFEKDFSNQPADRPAASYDFRSKYAAVFGKTGPYLYGKEDVLADLQDFVNGYRE